MSAFDPKTGHWVAEAQLVFDGIKAPCNQNATPVLILANLRNG